MPQTQNRESPLGMCLRIELIVCQELTMERRAIKTIALCGLDASKTRGKEGGITNTHGLVLETMVAGTQDQIIINVALSRFPQPTTF